MARNVAVQDDNARPAIADPLGSIDGYHTVLLASPIWNVRPPMIMSTFTDGHDFTGKTVLPVVTYAVCGLGSAVRDSNGRLSRRPDRRRPRRPGEEVTRQRSQVSTWLRDAGLTTH